VITHFFDKKQDKILPATLELFANEDFNATSNQSDSQKSVCIAA